MSMDGGVRILYNALSFWGEEKDIYIAPQINKMLNVFKGREGGRHTRPLAIQSQ